MFRKLFHEKLEFTLDIWFAFIQNKMTVWFLHKQNLEFDKNFQVMVKDLKKANCFSKINMFSHAAITANKD